jgi:serine/threonine protein kinase
MFVRAKYNALIYLGFIITNAVADNHFDVHLLWLSISLGGDLNSLLKRDGYLPETSVRMFGLDIVNGLKVIWFWLFMLMLLMNILSQYLHSLGVIHCDLRPSNFLIDEYGIVKISDFKCSRKIPKAPLGDAPINTRGAVPYLAPELFASNGVHSFQSDFWALGKIHWNFRWLLLCHLFRSYSQLRDYDNLSMWQAVFFMS